MYLYFCLHQVMRPFAISSSISPLCLDNFFFLFARATFYEYCGRVFVYLSSVYVQVCVCKDQSSTLSFFFNCFPPYFETGSLMEPGSHKPRFACQKALEIFLSSTFPEQGLQACTALGFLHGTGYPNSGPFACGKLVI